MHRLVTGSQAIGLLLTLIDAHSREQSTSQRVLCSSQVGHRDSEPPALEARAVDVPL